MIPSARVALLLLLLLPLQSQASTRQHLKRAKARHPTRASARKPARARAIPPDPDRPDPFFKTIDSKAFLVVDGLEYPVPRNISRRPAVPPPSGQEVFTAVDPTQ